MKAISRRSFLRTTGALTVALPALELTHGTAWAADPTKVAKRFVVFFAHGGSTCSRTNNGTLAADGAFFGFDKWRPPTNAETLTALGDEMKPLDGMQEHMLVLQGIINRAGDVQGPYGGGGHGYSNVTALTQANIVKLLNAKGEEYTSAEGPSIDQVISERLMQKTPTPFSRIDLTIAGHNYGTPFFSKARQPIGGQANAKKAFDTIFAGVSPSGPTPEMERIRKRKQSVLDGVLESFASFKRNLSAADAVRVEAHFDHVRSIEQRLASLDDIAACTPPAALDPKGAELTGPVMIDILVAALRCGLTNVGTYNLGDITTPWVKAPLSERGLVAYDIGHSLHHFLRDLQPGKAHDNDRDRADWLTEMIENRRWRLGLFRRLMDGLAESGDGAAGSMLDTSILYYTSEFSCGVMHSCVAPPTLVAGGGGGTLRTGRHINYNTAADDAPMQTDASLHNLYTTFLQSFGESDAHFGNDNAFRSGPLNLG